jgi:putative oxidoreductase
MSIRRIRNYLLLAPKTPMTESLILLTARVIFGFLFMSHGVAKWIMFKDASESFFDPIGLGPELSFWLVLFAEIVCSFGVILGALFRLSLIPIIFSMCVAVFVFHGGDPLNIVEPAMMYLTIFVLMFFSGPGEFSIDRIIMKLD